MAVSRLEAKEYSRPAHHLERPREENRKSAGSVISEKKLVESAQAGDECAFEQIYRSHVGHVYTLCLRMTGNTHLAQELTQETFLRVWDKLHTFKMKSSFYTWLHRVALNVALEHLRGQARYQTHVASLNDLRDRAPAEPCIGMRVDTNAAIAALPEGARTVFVLYEIEGLHHKEIARKLGIKADTSKAQLWRARRLLREMLK